MRERREFIETTNFEEGEMSRLSTSWRKSHRSMSGNCVEVRLSEAGEVQVRDSKHPDSPVLACTRAQWLAFVSGAKADEFRL